MSNIQQANNRIYIIDYIKAVAMISVIINHCNLGGKEELYLLFPYFIGLAVPIFIVLSGFTFSLSYQKKESLGLSHWFKKDTLLPKLSRFILPFLFIFVLEVIYKFGIMGMETDVFHFIRSLFFGGYGPGSYYVPLLIQMLFLFPFCYIVVRKLGFKGVILLGVIQLFYQIFAFQIDMDDIYYKRFLLRFLVFLGCGIYLYLHKEDILSLKRNRIWLSLSFLGGAVYIFFANYLNMTPEIFLAWKRTAMPTVFYVFPLLAVMITTCLYKKIPGKLGNLLSTIGQATYHILLVQMFWFHIGWEKTLPPYIQVPLNIILTVTLGILFYQGENHIRKKFATKTKAKDDYKSSAV